MCISEVERSATGSPVYGDTMNLVMQVKDFAHRTEQLERPDNLDATGTNQDCVDYLASVHDCFDDIRLDKKKALLNGFLALDKPVREALASSIIMATLDSDHESCSGIRDLH